MGTMAMEAQRPRVSFRLKLVAGQFAAVVILVCVAAFSLNALEQHRAIHEERNVVAFQMLKDISDLHVHLQVTRLLELELANLDVPWVVYEKASDFRASVELVDQDIQSIESKVTMVEAGAAIQNVKQRWRRYAGLASATAKQAMEGRTGETRDRVLFGSSPVFGQLGQAIDETARRIQLLVLDERNKMHEAEKRTSWLLLLSSLVGVLLVVLMAAWPAWSVARRVGKVTDAARRITAGDLDQVLDVHGSDEIGTLTSAFNRMIATVHARDADIRAYARELEQRQVELQAEIIERKRAEDALRRSEANLQVIIEATADGILAVDHKGVVIKANQKFMDLWRVPQAVMDTGEDDAMLSFVLDQLVDPDSFLEKVRSLYGIADIDMDTLFFKDGRVFERYSAPLMLENSIAGRVWSFRDMTAHRKADADRLEMERRMLLAQKRESLGTMAGAIAHHFNNLLGAVMGNLELAKEDLSRGVRIEGYLSEAMTASQRASKLSSLMLTYVGQTDADWTLCDLSREVERSMPLIIASFPGKARLRKTLAANLPSVMASGDALGQIMLALVTNAWEALGGAGGEVSITTGFGSFDERYLSRTVGVEAPPAGDYVFLEVADDGCGMDRDTVARMFDPFYSTKFTGRGLDLAAVAGMVRSCRGAILVTSGRGEGTAVRVLLPAAGDSIFPVAGEADTAPSVSRLAAPSSSGPLTVLLAEDEEMVRNMVRTMLERLGYTVITARDGAEALEVFRQQRDRIGCVLLDLTMPRLDGWEVLQSIREMGAGVPVILASGYDEGQVMQGGKDERPQAFLHKPYRMAELRDKLRSVGV